jgi:hypothetical protein
MGPCDLEKGLIVENQRQEEYEEYDGEKQQCVGRELQICGTQDPQERCANNG